MLSAPAFHLSRIIRAIWFLPAVFSVLAILVVVVSGLLGASVPHDITAALDLEVVDGILDILASSMLAVSIFPLTTMVAAIQAATQAQRRGCAAC